MKRRIIVFVFMALAVLAYGTTASAQTLVADTINGIDDESVFDSNSGGAGVKPQIAVVCRGWHALCDFSTDCEVVGNTANCACWEVNEPYIVITSKIQDKEVKKVTQTHCTAANPCDVNEAPVCKAIRSGQYKVKNVKYPWVSTFSYRGWCDNWNPVACASGPWADCMAAPCTVIQDPFDPERPLSCQCRLMTGEFIATQGNCDPGNVMSTIPRGSWDFTRETFSFPMPGYEYVKGACAILQSDNPAALP